MSSTAVRGTPAWLRATNDRTAMSLLLEHGELTRNRLGELSGLSKPTAAQMISRLEDAGLIEVAGEVSGGRGPNAVTYAVRADRLIGIAVDISATTMLATIVDATGGEHPVAAIDLDSLPTRSAVSDLRAAIDAASAASDIDPSLIRLARVGVQAAVAPRTDELAFTNTLPGWPSTGIRALLEQELGIDVLLENDTNLAAIAERAAGTADGVDGFALLWLGDGLGVAIDLAGQLYRGAGGGAGEIGYLAMPTDAVHLDPEAESLTDLLGAAAFSRLVADDPDTAIARFAERVAIGVIPVLAVLDPERVVLGGPVGIAGGAELADRVAAHLAATSRWSPHVVTSAVTDQPVLRGARDGVVADIRERLFDTILQLDA